MSIEEFINRRIDKMKRGEVFTLRGLKSEYISYMLTECGICRLPFDDTIGRRLRARRQARGDINYFDRRRSFWWKNDHEATTEERNKWTAEQVT